MSAAKNIFLPTPTIIISIGEFAERTAIQVRNLYLRSDPRRKLVTQFLKVVGDQKNSLSLVNLETDVAHPDLQPVDSSLLETDVPSYRQKFLKKVIDNSAILKTGIEQAVYQIRTHELLIEAGWGEEYSVPVNIYVLADIRDPFAAGLLLPLCCIVNEIATNTNLCKVHVLLNTAIFPHTLCEQETGLEAQTYSLLLELDDYLRDDSRNRDLLLTALGFEDRQPPDLTMYLFDSHKEGSYVVKDNSKMMVMIGNALLALLQKDTAQRIDAMHDRFEISERASFYNSMGASLFAYDPESLQRACAKRMATEFLNEVVLCKSGIEPKNDEISHTMMRLLGSLHAWFEQLFSETPIEIGQIRLDPETHQLALFLTDLNLQEIDYLHLHETPWVEQLKECETDFQNLTFNKVQSSLKKNALGIQEDLGANLRMLLDELPGDVNIYPGGIKNALATLDTIIEYLENETKAVHKLRTLLGEKEEAVGSEFVQELDELQAILDRFPKISWILRVIPNLAQVWANPVFYSLFYAKLVLQVQNQKNNCIQLLQNKVAIAIQIEAISYLDDLVAHLLQIAAEYKKDFSAFEEKVAEVLSHISDEWQSFPLGQQENGWDENFRISVVDPCFAQWAYQKWHQPLDGLTRDLISEEKIFMDWKNLTCETLREQITAYGEKVFTPLWDINLDDIFRLWAENTRGFAAEQPLSPSLISKCMLAAYPLLKPDFDTVGGSGLSNISSHCFIAHPDWQFCKIKFRDPKANQRETIFTGDPYHGLCIEVRHSVPLDSLIELIRPGRNMLLSLPAADRSALELIPSLATNAAEEDALITPEKQE